MTNEEFKNALEERTLVFSVMVIEYLYRLPKHAIFAVIINQLAKSSTSIGANYQKPIAQKARLTSTIRLVL